MMHPFWRRCLRLGIISENERAKLCRGKSLGELRDLVVDGKVSINDVRRELNLRPVDGADALRPQGGDR